MTRHSTKVLRAKSVKKVIRRGKPAAFRIRLTAPQYTGGGRVLVLDGNRRVARAKTSKSANGVTRVRLTRKQTRRLTKGRVRLRFVYRGTRDAMPAKARAWVRVRGR